MTNSQTRIIEKELRRRARRTMLIAIDEALDAELAHQPSVGSGGRAAISRPPLLQDQLNAARGVEHAAADPVSMGSRVERPEG